MALADHGSPRGANARGVRVCTSARPARHAVEAKLRRDTETKAEALDQVAGYLDLAGLDDDGFLVMFDLRRELSWQDRITSRDVAHAGRQIRIFGC